MNLYLNTVSKLLWETLKELMSIAEFDSFRLVGGTSLSLQLGHRMSVDIDLFTDAEYRSIDFDKLDQILKAKFTYVEYLSSETAGMGKSYFLGHKEDEQIKLDLFYTDSFVFPAHVYEGVRLASKEEIVAMKLEVIALGGRKKDYWDIHELLNSFDIHDMVAFYMMRYPYGVSKEELLSSITDFSVAEYDFTPNCLRGKFGN